MVLNILLFPSGHLQFGKKAVKKQKCCFCSEWSIIKCLARFVIGAINPCGQNCCNSLQQNMQKAIYQLSRAHTHTMLCWKLLFLPSLKVGSYSIVWVAYFFCSVSLVLGETFHWFRLGIDWERLTQSVKDWVKPILSERQKDRIFKTDLTLAANS